MPATPEILSSQRLFAGTQQVLAVSSEALAGSTRLAVYLPDRVAGERAPWLLWLSGLTCSEENFTVKAGAQRLASELGLVLVAPDTSPRGDGVPDDPQGSYDFGLGAGFYVDATEAPWSTHYHMRTYIEQELLRQAADWLPVDPARVGISGHSMGGHGALTIALRAPNRFRSVSAFAPICSPLNCPWGHKALGGYLGDDRAAWRAYDACALIEEGARLPELLVDQGADDSFLTEQLMPQRLAAACAQADIKLTLRMQPGFDHSYYFIASFIDDHLRWHHQRLTAAS